MQAPVMAESVYMTVSGRSANPFFAFCSTMPQHAFAKVPISSGPFTTSLHAFCSTSIIGMCCARNMLM